MILPFANNYVINAQKGAYAVDRIVQERRKDLYKAADPAHQREHNGKRQDLYCSSGNNVASSQNFAQRPTS